MAIELQQILGLLAFALFLAWVNTKASQWPIEWVTLLGSLAAVIGAGVVLYGWIF